MDFTLRVTFGSDWHVGDGAGQPGNVDRMVRRDPRTNLPFIPAKTLTGMLRDGCERVAWALDGGKIAAWASVVRSLFGSQPASDGIVDGRPPLPARLSIRPAVFSDALTAVLGTCPEAQEALTFIKSGVSIDPAAGTARHNQLRMEEMVRADSVLTARCSLNEEGLSNDAKVAVQALVWSSTFLVRRIGGKRRRGAGRCRLEFRLAGSQDRVAGYLTRLANAPPTIPTRKAPITTDAATPSSADGGARWFRIPLLVKLETPVVVPTRVVGNVVQCADHIPGTALLGPVRRALGALLPGAPLHEAIGRGSLRVLNAYVDIDGQRGLPVPSCIFFDKERGDLASEHPLGPSLVNALAGEVPAANFRPHRAGYVGPASGNTLPRLTRVDFHQQTHSTISDSEQRPTEEVGGVFTYQALPAGLTLATEIRLSDDIWQRLTPVADWRARLASELNTACQVGIAKKDDYGRISLTLGSGDREAVTSSLQYADTVTLWLLSDLLVRNNALQPDPTPTAVARVLERTIRDATNVEVSIRPLKAFVRTRRTDGWHVGWQRPRPSYVGIQAGAALTLAISGCPDEQRDAVALALRDLECTGIGERRAEGFGEAAVNATMVAERYERKRLPPRADRTDTGTSVAPLLTRTDDDYDYAVRLEREMWLTRIRRRALTRAIDAEWRQAMLGLTRSAPNNAQLGTLKALVQAIPDADGADDIDRLTAWLQDDRRWSDASLIARLRSEPERLWTALEVDSLPPLTSRGHGETKRALWPAAMRSLLLAAIQAERRDRERPEPVLQEEPA